MKLCLIYNFAQHYRSSIFLLMDKELGCDFVFGDSMGDVKKMDYSLLTGKVVENHTLKFKGCTFQRGVLKQIRQEYTHYILLGDTRSISTWLFCIISRLFYKKKKVYFWTHGWYGKEGRFERALKKIFFRLPNGGVFTYGHYARNLMISEGFDSEKLFVIHNSLDYDTQLTLREKLRANDIFTDHFGNTNRNLIFVGRLTKVKKLDQVLHAMVLSRDKGFKYNLTLVGSGDMKAELQALVQQLGLVDSVWFYGACYDENKLGNLIYNADLCVSPGNIGLTAMHALTFGTPAITHNDFKWQMPEFEAIKEGRTGSFFKRDDVNDLSEKIDTWFNSHTDDREIVRNYCMAEIDREWNPYYQIKILKEGMNYE